MRPFIAILAITMALICLAMAQTFDFVPTKPCPDNSNAPASTAYVHACAGGGGGGVTSWNGRIGVVTPQTGDYAFSNISGVATGAQLPFPSASTLGAVESFAPVTNQFLTGLNTSGVFSAAQPAFSNISGTVGASQLPFPSASTLGGVLANTAGGGQFVNGINPATGALTYGTPAGGGGSPGGSNGQVQFNNSGAFGGLTNTQLTADINVFTSTLSGTVPASGGSSTTSFLAQNGTFQTPAGGGNVSTSGTITTGNCAQWASATTIQSTSAPCSTGGGGGTNLGTINIASFGSIGDGNCHPLSGIYASLAAAQAVYSFVSDLTQCVDWAATQAAVNSSYNTAPLANGSFPVGCPVGKFQLSNPVILSTPTNGTSGSAAAWAVGTTYANGATVKYNGIPFISAGSGNVGNAPTLYNNFPSQMQIVGGGNTPSGYPWANVQISNASPAVITPLLGGGSNNVVANQPIVFFTQQFANPNGGSAPALPTGINANQVYYVVGSSITGSTFQVSTTPGGGAVNTSSAGVGNFFASGQVWQFAPVQSGDNFNIRISFVGSEGLPSNSGCVYQTQGDFTAPAFVVGPGNGNIIKNVYVQGNVSVNGANTTSPNGYRCSSLASLDGPAQANSSGLVGGQLAAIGWAVMSDGGGASKTKFENVGAFGFYVNDWRSYGRNGSLVDQNLWEKINYGGACINIYGAATQAFINEIIDGTITEGTTNVVGSIQEGFIVHGGITSTFDAAAQTFTISSVTFTASCGNSFFGCVQATISSPDNNFQSPMCAYSAGQANNAQVKWLNSWPFASGCGYNTFIIKTANWGAVGMYMMNYNPFTGVATFGIPQAFAGIYQGTCCGSNFTTQIQAATTLYAVEAATMYYGDNQVDNVHVENDGVSYTMGCFCTNFFGGAKPAQFTQMFMNVAADLGASACCNNTGNNYFVNHFTAQQVIPFWNSTVGDTIAESIVGGANSPGNNGNSPSWDRVLVATGTTAYLEMRHSTGTNNPGSAPSGGQISSGSIGNASAPLYDFAPSGVTGFFTNAPPLVNPGTLGQLSGGYYAMGGSGLGGGLWDNGSSLVPAAAFSANASNQPTDMFHLWQTKGWGQAPQWGVRPAPWTNACILPSQATSLGALPAITYIASLRDFLVVTNGGTSGTYAVNNVLTLVGGTGTAATVNVDAVSGGQVTAVHLLTDGAYTTIAPGLTTFTSTGGGGTGATFSATGQIWYVNYNIGYPALWGGHIYHACNWNDASFAGPKYAIKSTHTGYSYFQNLTTTNVPHLSWTMDGASPFINMNYEALQLMYPGLVIGLVSDGTGGCTAIAQQNFMVLETHPTLGYVKVVRMDNDGSNYVPSLAASGTTCKNTTINQAAFAPVNPY